MKKKRGKLFLDYSIDEKKILIKNNQKFIELHMFDWEEENLKMEKKLEDEAAKFGLSNILMLLGMPDRKEIQFEYGPITLDILRTINKFIENEKQKSVITMLKESTDIFKAILELKCIEITPICRTSSGFEEFRLANYVIDSTSEVSKEITSNRLKVMKKNTKLESMLKMIKKTELQFLYGSIKTEEVDELIGLFLIEKFLELINLKNYFFEKVKEIEKNVRKEYSSIFSTEHILKKLADKQCIYISEKGQMFSLL